MHKLIVVVSLAAMLGISVPGWSCTPVDVLPGWIDPLIAPKDYPCVMAGMEMPDPGAIPFYDENGDLGFLDTRGRFLNQYGTIVDNVKRYMLADDAIAIGEWVIIMQNAIKSAGRALQRTDLLP